MARLYGQIIGSKIGDFRIRVDGEEGGAIGSQSSLMKCAYHTADCQRLKFPILIYGKK